MSTPSRQTRPDAPRVKASLSPAEFYGVELPAMPKPRRDTGWTDGGLCPFHADTHSGSFFVNLDTGGFHCFACGVKGGDIIAFLQVRHGLSFSETLKMICENWGIPE